MAPVQRPIRLLPAAVFIDGGGGWIGAAADSLVALRRWTCPRRCLTTASAVFNDSRRESGYGGDWMGAAAVMDSPPSRAPCVTNPSPIISSDKELKFIFVLTF
jgi:hypothetical protein